jgi:tetratricopeptide (TPR) repeat protein
MASDSKTKILREAERYVQQGKISSAINEYLKIARENPEDVLTHNMLGDLYLKQGRIGEANQTFLRVAECYARNNFLLKAIAVYKKILNAEPSNHEVSLKMASLYARQGLNVEACNLYLLVGDLCALEGKNNESLAAFEKAVEIDPLNAPVQLNLAAVYLSQDCKEKAYHHLVGAARAQMKKADVTAAMTSFQRALAINLCSAEALHGYVESALHMGELSESLERVKDSIAMTPADPGLLELLGRAYMSAGDLDHAEKCFLSALAEDESCYPHFLALSRILIEKGDLDRAMACLDRIASIMISRRESQKLAECYRLILARSPEHLETLRRLGDLLSDTNEAEYCEVLERIIRIHQNAGRPDEALKAVEKILDIRPDSEKCVRAHRELFVSVYPDMPYQLPPGVIELRYDLTDAGGRTLAGEPPANESSEPTFVEVDLLLNYGMKEKALQLLRNLEQKRPGDKDVRLRLLSLYRDAGELRLAAEQSILLSALYRKSGDLEAAQNALETAAGFDAEWVRSVDVGAFAREHGISLEAARPESPATDPALGMELDLSGDLSEIFFRDTQAPPDKKENGQSPAGEAAAEEFPAEISSAPPESIEEQLQEVDFYIRLGFLDEARAKLNQIAQACPGHLDLASRCAQIGGEPPSPAKVPSGCREMNTPAAVPASSAEPLPDVAKLFMSDLDNEGFTLHIDAAPAGAPKPSAGFPEESQFESAGRAETAPANTRATSIGHAAPDSACDQPGMPPASDPDANDGPTNLMFADLITEMNSLTDQEIAREDFETHFHLGVAFREMGLIEDAIKEFQTSMKILDPAKSPKEAIQCCGMLSTCFLEKGMSRSAIRWCQAGLRIREISSHESIALRYDMAVAHDLAGDASQALECFNAVFQMDPGYRDVALRIDDLKNGPRQHAP